MPRWTKWIAVAVLIVVPAIGFAVTKVRAHHRGCPLHGGCAHAQQR